ncbi:hypothetical protein SDC9_203271 [bioreactor metagenome]|uniref:Uncharacterized protein n=1 Tax=bioreactor metagenome TaxID=1076179 RepID=A0A645IWS2_9ZZZZ
MDQLLTLNSFQLFGTNQQVLDRNFISLSQIHGPDTAQSSQPLRIWFCVLIQCQHFIHDRMLFAGVFNFSRITLPEQGFFLLWIQGSDIIKIHVSLPSAVLSIH